MIHLSSHSAAWLCFQTYKWLQRPYCGPAQLSDFDGHAKRRCRTRGTSSTTRTRSRVLASSLSCTSGQGRCCPHTRGLRAMHID